MALTITKGSSLSITKGLTAVRLEASWNPQGPRAPYDLDITSLAVDTTGGLPGVPVEGTDHVCYFGQKVTPAMRHLKGDNLTGEGDGPDEVILIELDKIPAKANTIPLIVTLFNAKAKGQTMAEVPAAEIKLFDHVSGAELGTAKLAALESGSVSALFAALERQADGSWVFNNVSEGYQQEIGDWFHLYGLA